MKKLNWYIYLSIFLILDSLFPIFLYFAIQTAPTLWIYTFSIFIAFLFWLIIFFKDRLFNEYKKREILIPAFLSALLLGLWWLLYFFWIEYSSPSTASILLLLQSFFAFIIFNLFWKENYHSKQVIWSIFMFIWWIIILYKWETFINIWSIIMVIACILFTVWNFYTKKASLKWASPFFLLINRYLLMFIITLILAVSILWPIDLNLIKQNLIWIFLIWFFALFLWKAFWILALTKLDSFVAISSFPIVPLLVMLFSFIFLKEVPNFREILWFIPIAIWAILLIQKNKTNK